MEDGLVVLLAPDWSALLVGCEIGALVYGGPTTDALFESSVKTCAFRRSVPHSDCDCVGAMRDV